MTPRSRRSSRRSPHQPVLEESPELRRHSLERARTVRRVLGVIVMALLLVVTAWAAWYAWTVRSASVSMQTPLRNDAAAMRRLDPKRPDLTLLVVRASRDASVPVVAILRQPAKGAGSWLLALPNVPVPTSDAASETPAVLRARGRASLLKAVENLARSGLGHYVEFDASALASALGEKGSDAATQPAEASSAALASGSPSSTLGVVANIAKRYQAQRARRFAVLRVPGLARNLVNAAESDLAATQLDVVLRRLGADANAGRLQLAVVPVEVVDRHAVASAAAAEVLVARMLKEQPFGKVTIARERVAPGSLTVSVLNGAGREGVAAQAGRILGRAGYRVKSVGNANQFVYDRTLVVYKTKRPPAESVARDLGFGKVVASRGMYGFTTDILVIVGSDWPQAP